MSATMTAPMNVVEVRNLEASRSQSWLTTGPAIVLYIAVAKLLLHLLTASRYGYFRDELYYLACSEHLDWGYVDQPPLIALIAWLVRHTLGDSLLAIRFLPALAGAALVWLTGKLAREMGGGRFAQALSALGIVFIPIYLIMHHWITMNAFEPLIWMGCAWCIVRAINTGEPRYWLIFGLLVGVGMENKYSVAFFVFGVLIGLLATPERRFLKSRWVWIGALLALLVFLPNLIWLVRHNFPFLELMHNIRRGTRDVVRNPISFIADQAMILNPVLFPLWAGGVAWLLFARNGRRYRVLGWTYVATLAAFIALKGKNYYVAPVYPMLFAAGAIALEQFTQTRQAWMRHVYVVLVLIAGIALMPISAPILSPESYIRYQKAIGLEPPRAENQPLGPLPQYFADEFGWDEMARETARVYNSLPPEERARTAIFANGYGQAAAIDFFGPKYGLPKVISRHQNYWLWGPRNYTGEIVIVLGSNGKGDREHFKSVEAAGQTFHPYTRHDEHFTIWLCRGLTWSFQELWPNIKKWN